MYVHVRLKNIIFLPSFLLTKKIIKSTWKTINDVLGKVYKKVIHFDIIICNGNVVKDSLDIAHALNSYFANIGPNLADNIPTPTKPFYTFLRNQNPQSTIYMYYFFLFMKQRYMYM